MVLVTKKLPGYLRSNQTDRLETGNASILKKDQKVCMLNGEDEVVKAVVLQSSSNLKLKKI